MEYHIFRRPRRTEIIATLGPVIDRDNDFEKAIAAGVSVVRINSFHGSPEDHKMCTDKAREIAAKLGRHVATLGDLQEPKTCVSTFKEGKAFLNIGDEFLLGADLGKGEGDKEEVGIDYKGLPADTMPGDILLLNDGCVQLRVLEVQGMKVFIKVTVDGPLSNSKGINELGGGLLAEALAEKNKADIKTAALIGVDYPAVFFPRCGEDLNYARRLICNVGYGAKVIAKVECAGAVCSQGAIDDIILASDVVVATRGDLGVEIGDLELVGIQKAPIRRARRLSCAATTATQMMELMITNPMPTCAEVMDVANATLDGADAIMLLAGTAAGQYPSETIAAMTRVCPGTEEIPSINVSKHRLDIQFDNVEEAIAMPTVYMANHLRDVTATITMTESGRTALTIPCISSDLLTFITPRHERTLNLTTLYRGVMPVHFDNTNDGVTAVSETASLLRDKGHLMPGDLVIVIQGNVMSTVGLVSTTRILTVE